MLTTRSSSRMSSVQWLIESRPPSLTWARPSPQQSNQPALDLIDQNLIMLMILRQTIEVSG